MKKPYVTMLLVVRLTEKDDIVRTSTGFTDTTVLDTDNAGLWDEAW